MWLLILSCKKRLFALFSKCTLFFILPLSLLPSSHTFLVSLNFIRKKNQLATTRLWSHLHLVMHGMHCIPYIKLKKKRTNSNITLPKHFWTVIGSIYFQSDHHHQHNRFRFFWAINLNCHLFLFLFSFSLVWLGFCFFLSFIHLIHTW